MVNAATICEAQRKLVDALMFLSGHCDGAVSRDGVGFKGGHANMGFLNDMREKYAYSRAMTVPQMNALLNILNFYKDTQLGPNGFTLPTREEIKNSSNVVPDKNIIDIELGHIKFHFIYDPKTDAPLRMKQLKEAYREKTNSARYKEYTGPFARTSNLAWATYNKEEVRYGLKCWWTFPKSVKTFQLIMEYLPQLQMTPAASEYYREVLELEHEQQMQEQAAQQRKEQSLAQIVGDLDAPLPNGMTLFAHQKIAIRYFVEKRRVICGDQMGLGKTFEALIAAKKLQDYYGWNIIVITTKSNMTGFNRAAAMLGCSIECTTWRGMPIATNEHPYSPFVLIGDEAHYAGYMSSQQSKNFISLSWHPNCKALFAMTGTIAKNGRPINLYPLLLAVKHPLVFPMGEDWTPDYPLIWKKKSAEEGMFLPEAIHRKSFEFQRNYCGAHEEVYGRGARAKRVWKTDGATNLEALNLMTQYKPDRERNHAWSCIITRRKKDCLDLPEKRRIMVEAEISPEAEKLFHAKIEELRQRFEANVQAKLKALREAIEARNRGEKNIEVPSNIKQYFDAKSKTPRSIDAELYDAEERMRSAEALNAYMRFRHAAAIAKAEQTLAQSLQLLDNGEKIVLFTNFKDTADWLKENIEKERGEQGICFIINGDVAQEDRDSAVDDFQSENGKLKVIIGMAAAKEAITLTAASYLILNDRFWTPGDNDQAEDRIHRIGSKNECVIYWPQLPESISDIDIKIDALIEQKLINIAQLQYGERVEGIEFTSDKGLEELAIKAMRSLLETKKTRSRKAVKA